MGGCPVRDGGGPLVGGGEADIVRVGELDVVGWSGVGTPDTKSREEVGPPKLGAMAP